VASKRRMRRQACGSKRRYLTPEEGRVAIWQLNRTQGVPGYRGHMNVYKCKFCHSYHVGHRPNSIAKA